VTSTAPGRRERKKAATRQALADAALAMFLERGFDRVTVAEVAEAADVSVATLFKYFPSKEALLFDRDADREAELVAAVRDRPTGVSIVDALQAFLTSRIETRTGGADVENLRKFRALVTDTPSLSAYLARMWARHTDALAAAIAAELGLAATPPLVRALAYLAVQAPVVARGAEGDPREQLDAYFTLLRTGWDAQEKALSPMPDG
jgi:AcrR family transcriptional regulator